MSAESPLSLRVNGAPVTVPAGSSVGDVVAVVLEDRPPRGIAVSVDRCVIPRSLWDETPARAGSLVEVVEAAAGG
jgi:thiamine biosynthesis protein ThiS